ncbi:thiamine pyrophosphokinase-related protein-like protein [Lineolata rhizophorae]|uniref:Thiamine pyrophosphokinase-related protein-like protein n=1 Tax=Lineolata rhizophorae TaxID=578093 RepID=A0A6A6P5F3_9PEZI|nr:thiamine pyrophosphokinase-related protein-like protein [Lineolata rhizophorae]
MAAPNSATNLELVDDCDRFPYFQTNPEAYERYMNTLYAFQVPPTDPDSPPPTVGLVLPRVAEVLRGLPDWEIDDDALTLTLTGGTDAASRSAIVAQMAAAMRKTGHFQVLAKWRNELYPVYATASAPTTTNHLFDIERAASPLFGIVTYGVHLTGFVRDPDAPHGLKIWVPRRARAKTYGSMLDNTVAGGVATGEEPFETLVREAAEEASLPEPLIRERATAVGTVSYFYIREERAGGETGLMQPECQYAYDIELPPDVVPKPNDDEVEGFYLWTVNEIKAALSRREFKPNCAIVMLDFFVRQGILTIENEPDYVQIVARLHRMIDLPKVR